MHLDPGHVPSIPTSLDHRAVTASTPTKAHHRAHGPESSPSQRGRDPEAFSADPDTPSKTYSGVLSISSRSSAANSSAFLMDQQPEYTFSPATVARADRARVYFELSHQHRRLLEFLPPLQQAHRPADRSAHDLGRPYDPLQFLRNREARATARSNFDAERGGWGDLSAVKGWVNSVEHEAAQEGYLEGDIAHLPRWAWGSGLSTNPRSDAHRNGEGEVTQKRFQPVHNFWMAAPCELLADAYWLEQNDHKRFIHTKNGHQIFKDFFRPNRRRTGTGTSGRTYETQYTATSDEDIESSTKSPQTRTFSNASLEGGLGGSPDTDDVHFSPQHRSKASIVKRHLLRKHKDPTDQAQQSSEDDSDRSIEGFPTRRGPKNTNIGPLERHMKMMIEKEQQGQDLPISLHNERQDGMQGNEGNRRGGVSEESPKAERNKISHHNRKGMPNTFRLPPLNSKRESSTDTPRISIEDTDGDQRQGKHQIYPNGHGVEPNKAASKLGEPLDVEQVVNRASRLGFLKRHRGHVESATAETDFAHGNNATKRPRSANSDSESERQMQSTLTNYTSSESLAYDKMYPETRSPMAKRFFKASRIGEIMRHEKPDTGARGVDIPQDQPTSPRSRDYFSSDTDDSRPTSRRNHRKQTWQDLPGQPSGQRRHQSLSVSSRRRVLRAPEQRQYHIQGLPSFVPRDASPEKDRWGLLAPNDDHIARQQHERGVQRKTSRLNSLKPPSIETSDVSPNTSSPDLSRTGTRTTAAPTLNDSASRESLSDSQAVSNPPQPAAIRLRNALGNPGQLGKGALPPTRLTALDPGLDPARRSQYENQGSDAGSKTPVALRRPHSDKRKAVTHQKIAYVRTLILSSGVKAATIVARANAPRAELPSYICSALVTAGRNPDSMGAIPRQQEFAVAAQALSSHLQSLMSSFDSSALKFRNETCHNLNAKIDDLRDLVSNHLTHQVHEEGDRADGFVAQLTTTHTLSIKQVNDSVDLMMRKRRQRLRWMRRAGFGVLEWVLVGFMWGIWVVVRAVGLVKGTIGAVVALVKWLLFLR